MLVATTASKPNVKIFPSHFKKKFKYFNSVAFKSQMLVWGCSSVIECLSSISNALGSIPRTTEDNNNKIKCDYI